MAWQAASIMPSPSPRASTFSPSRDQHDPWRWLPTVLPPWSSSDSSSNASSDRAAELLGHDGLEVGVGELHLAVGQLLEAGEGGVEGVALELDAHLLERVGEGVAAGVLAQHDLALAGADRRWVHDLVGGALGQHAVLVDAGLVGEGVAADDRLVVLHRVAGEAAHQAAGAGQLLGADRRCRARRTGRAGSAAP